MSGIIFHVCKFTPVFMHTLIFSVTWELNQHSIWSLITLDATAVFTQTSRDSHTPSPSYSFSVMRGSSRLQYYLFVCLGLCARGVMCLHCQHSGTNCIVGSRLNSTSETIICVLSLHRWLIHKYGSFVLEFMMKTEYIGFT